MTKPIHLYSHKGGPNPWKVAILLEELGVPYENDFVDPKSLHTPTFEVVNPNGRVPAIHDPNTDITLWESGAIIQYLLETYDKDNKLQPAPGPERFQAQQWLFFQASGQGPYFGQFVWFNVFHSEQLPSAKERYAAEVLRVTKVLDGVLKDREWLVGDKCTYADLSFIPWYDIVNGFPDISTKINSECPNWAAWLARLQERPAVKKVAEEKAKAKASH